LDEARKIADKIATKGKIACQKVKEVTLKGFNMDFSEAAKLEIQEFGDLFANAESKEGMKAFLEKRKPNW
jgi:enoyl-CoA hydratase/carnithine racemase